MEEAIPLSSRPRDHKAAAALDTPDSDAPASTSSSTSHTVQLTPEEDSMVGSDVDIELHHRHAHPYSQAQVQESFEMRSYKGRDLEKRHAQEEDEEDEHSEDEEEEEEEQYLDSRRRRRGSASTTQSFQLYTPDEERAVVRKLDRNLVLFVSLLYMLSFLDRSNIGNARIAGLYTDLNLTSDQYEWIITSFYIAYIVFEWMSILWKLIPAHIYVSIIVLSWGITASLQSVSTSFGMLLVFRTLLGIGEAGFTGIPFYLSFFFKREELALRTGLFISAAPLATTFASSLAWLITTIGEHTPIAPWRLLFLIEGMPSVFIAVLAWIRIPDSPAQARYLTKREKKVARLRLRKEKTNPNDSITTATTPPHHHSQARKHNHPYGIKWREVLATLTDPKCYLTAAMFFGTNMAFASMPVFLPVIIQQMGHSSTAAQALSAPPYLLSFIFVILTAFLSDRLRTRSTFIIVHALLSASGYAFIALAGVLGWSPWLRYAALFPAAVGFFSVITLIITWSVNNQDSESKQSAGFAVLQIVGQCGPLVGTRLYPEGDGPLYVRGMVGCAGAMVGVAALALGLRVWLVVENRRSERRWATASSSASGVDDGEEEEGVALVGGGGGGGEEKEGRGRKRRFVYML